MIILAQILAFITRKPRYFPEIKWSSNSWTHNIFRFYEMIFGRRYGIRLESSVIGHQDKRGLWYLKYKNYTLEAKIAYFETKIREILAFNPLRQPSYVMQRGAIGYDNSSDTISTSYSFATTGSDRLMIIGPWSLNDTVTGATYNSVSATYIAKTGYPGSGRQGIRMYYLIAPATGSNTLTASGTLNGIAVDSFTGCNQTSPIDSSNTASSASAPLTMSTTVVGSNCWLVGLSCDPAGGETGGTSTTVRATSGWGTAVSDSNGTVGTGSQSLIINYSSGPSEGVIASFSPSASAGGTVTPISTLAFMGAG